MDCASKYCCLQVHVYNIVLLCFVFFTSCRKQTPKASEDGDVRSNSQFRESPVAILLEAARY